LERLMARTSTNRELHSESVPMRGLAVLDLTSPTAPLPMAGIIESVDADVLRMDQPEKLQFAEEPIDIRLEPGSERNAPKWVPVAVNGDVKWLPVGTPIRIQRKFVEVLARCQPYSVATRHGSTMEERPHNHVERTPYRAHPFTILSDPNPRGGAWLQKVSAEG